MQAKLFKTLLLLSLLIPQFSYAELAVIIKPVIDFTYLPIAPHQTIPICPVKVGDDAISCPRIHQGLFNEIVEIIRAENGQLLIAVPNCFFQTDTNLEKQNQFWTDRANLLPLSDLGPHQAKIPAPIDFNRPESLANEQVVTLIAPYTSTATNQTYSVGTRFVLVPETPPQTTPTDGTTAPLTTHYQVYLYDPNLHQVIIDQIDRKLCLKLSETLPDLDHEQHRKLFITLLKSWVNHPTTLSSGPFTIAELKHSKNSLTKNNSKNPTNKSHHNSGGTSKTKLASKNSTNQNLTKTKSPAKPTVIKRYIQPRPLAPFIPYVWGGCSYTTLCADPYFQLKTVRSTKRPHAKPRRYFEYPTCRTQPYNGFDCTGLILRAAQASGLPYFYKNTATILQNLAPLQPEDQIMAGDLIWLPAHIMVISDVERNLCIEARHYAQGYGKVHETPIHKIFKGIQNYQDLRAAHFAQNLIERLDRHQKTTQQVKIKILKLKVQ